MSFFAVDPVTNKIIVKTPAEEPQDVPGLDQSQPASQKPDWEGFLNRQKQFTDTLPFLASPTAQEVEAWAETGPNRSFGNAFQQGIAQPVSGIGTGLRVFAGMEDLGSWLEQAKEWVPDNYISATEEFQNPKDGEGFLGFDWKAAPRAVVEQAGQLAGSVASRIMGATVGAATAASLSSPTGVGIAPAAAAGAAVGANVGPFLFYAMQVAGPIAEARAKNNGREVPNNEDKLAALSTAAISGALDAIGVRYLPGGAKAGRGLIERILKASAGEFVTEFGQETVEQTGETLLTKEGLDVNLKQSLGGGIIGAGSGASVSAVMDTASMATKRQLWGSDVEAQIAADQDALARAQKYIDKINKAAERREKANKQNPVVVKMEEAANAAEAAAEALGETPGTEQTRQAYSEQAAELRRKAEEAKAAQTNQPKPLTAEERLAERRRRLEALETENEYTTTTSYIKPTATSQQELDFATPVITQEDTKALEAVATNTPLEPAQLESLTKKGLAYEVEDELVITDRGMQALGEKAPKLTEDQRLEEIAKTFDLDTEVLSKLPDSVIFDIIQFGLEKTKQHPKLADKIRTGVIAPARQELINRTQTPPSDGPSLLNRFRIAALEPNTEKANTATIAATKRMLDASENTNLEVVYYDPETNTSATVSEVDIDREVIRGITPGSEQTIDIPVRSVTEGFASISVIDPEVITAKQENQKNDKDASTNSTTQGIQEDTQPNQAPETSPSTKQQHEGNEPQLAEQPVTQDYTPETQSTPQNPTEPQTGEAPTTTTAGAPRQRVLSQNTARKLLSLPTEKRDFPFGKQYAELRQDIIEEITGIRPPKTKAGATAVRDALVSKYGEDNILQGLYLDAQEDTAPTKPTQKNKNTPTPHKITIPRTASTQEAKSRLLQLKTLSKGVREFLENTSKTSENKKTQSLSKALLAQDPTIFDDVEIEVGQFGETPWAAKYDPAQKKISINLDMTDNLQGGTPTTLIHELVHHVFRKKLEQYRKNQESMTQVELDSLTSLQKTLDALQSIPDDHKIWGDISKRDKDNMRKSLEELMAEILTNPKAQSVLEKLVADVALVTPKRNETKFQAFLRILSELFFGRPQGPTSAYNVAFQSAFNLIRTNKLRGFNSSFIDYIYTPVIATVVEQGGIKSPQRRKQGSDRGAEYDGVISPLESGAGPFVKYIMSRNGGLPVDTMAQILYEEGLLADSYPDTLWDAMRQEIQSYKTIREQLAAQEEYVARQDQAYKTLVPTKPDKTRTPQSVDTLNVGDRFTSKGDQFEVTNYNESSYDITITRLKDKVELLFNTGSYIQIDTNSLIQPEIDESNPFSPADNDTLFTPADLQLVTEDIINGTIPQGLPEAINGRPGGKPKAIALEMRRIFDGNYTLDLARPISKYEKTLNKATDYLLQVADAAIKLFPNFKGWYGERVQMMENIMKDLDQDLQNPKNNLVFKVLLTVSSDGNSINAQFNDAWKAYNHWKKNGNLDAFEFQGTRFNTIKKNATFFLDILSRSTPERLIELMSKKTTPKKIKQTLREEFGYTQEETDSINMGELQDEPVPFATIFGPKLGSYFNNLNGDFSTTTMDRWFMRTLGRLTGSQLEKISSDRLQRAGDRLRNAAKLVANQNPEFDLSSAQSNEALYKRALRLSQFFANPNNRNQKIKAIDDLRRAANNYAKIGDGFELIETPKNGIHRRNIRAVIDNTLTRFNKKHGLNLEPAELQALLWYFEKTFHEKLGSRQKEKSPDYGTSANELYKQLKGTDHPTFVATDSIKAATPTDDENLYSTAGVSAGKIKALGISENIPAQHVLGTLPDKFSGVSNPAQFSERMKQILPAIRQDIRNGKYLNTDINTAPYEAQIGRKLSDEERTRLLQEMHSKQRTIQQGWVDYLETGGYTPEVQALILSTITKEIASPTQDGKWKFYKLGKNSDRLPDPASPELASRVAEMLTQPNHKDKKISQIIAEAAQESEKARRASRETVATSTETGGQISWIRFPSQKNDPNNFDKNVQDLTSLAKTSEKFGKCSWCTGSGAAHGQLQNGDFWVGVDENGNARAAIRMEGDEIAEIRGVLEGQNLEPKYAQNVVEFTESQGIEDIQEYGKAGFVDDARTKGALQQFENGEISWYDLINSLPDPFVYVGDKEEFKSSDDPVVTPTDLDDEQIIEVLLDYTSPDYNSSTLSFGKNFWGKVEETLPKLSEEARISLARNESAPPNILERLYRSNPEVRVYLAQNTNIPDNLLKALESEKTPSIIQSLAHNPKASPEFLSKHGKHADDPDLVTAIGMHPNTPADILKDYAKDTRPDSSRRKSILNRTVETPKEVLLELIKNDATSDTDKRMVLAIPNLDSDVVVELYVQRGITPSSYKDAAMDNIERSVDAILSKVEENASKGYPPSAALIQDMSDNATLSPSKKDVSDRDERMTKAFIQARKTNGDFQKRSVVDRDTTVALSSIISSTQSPNAIRTLWEDKGLRNSGVFYNLGSNIMVAPNDIIQEGISEGVWGSEASDIGKSIREKFAKKIAQQTDDYLQSPADVISHTKARIKRHFGRETDNRYEKLLEYQSVPRWAGRKLLQKLSRGNRTQAMQLAFERMQGTLQRAQKDIEFNLNRLNSALKEAFGTNYQGIDIKTKTAVDAALDTRPEKLTDAQHDFILTEEARARRNAELDYLKSILKPSQLEEYKNIKDPKSRKRWKTKNLDARQRSDVQSTMDSAGRTARNDATRMVVNDNVKTARRRSNQALASLPPKVQDAILDIRNHLSKVTAGAYRDGVLPSRFELKLDGNKIVTIENTYQIEGDQRLADEILENSDLMRELAAFAEQTWLDNAAQYYIQEAAEDGKTLDYTTALAMAKNKLDSDPDYGPQFGERTITKFIQASVKDPNWAWEDVFVKTVTMTNKQAEAFHKEGMPDILAKALMPFDDVTLMYASLAVKTAGAVARRQSLERLLHYSINTPENPDGWILRDGDPRLGGADYAGYVPVKDMNINIPGFKSVFKGYSVPEVFVKEMENTFSNESIGSACGALMYINSLAMRANTSLNFPRGPLRNFVGNITLVLQSGNFNPKYFGIALRSTIDNISKQSDREIQQYVGRMTELNLTDDSPNARIVDQLRRQSAGRSRVDDAIDKLSKGNQSIRGVSDLLNLLYQSPDNFWKSVMWEQEKAVVRKAEGKEIEATIKSENPDFTEEQIAAEVDYRIEALAAERVKASQPTFSRMNALGRAALKPGWQTIFAAFVGFRSEMIRIAIANPALAIKDLKSGNKIYQAAGARRLAGTALAYWGTYAIAAALKSIFNISDEEEEAARTLLAPWDADAQLLWWRDDNGNLKYFNTSFVNPLAVNWDPIAAAARAARNNGTLEGVKTLVARILDPFVSIQIGTQGIIEAMNNRTLEGRPISNPESEGYITDLLLHVFKSSIPQLYRTSTPLKQSIMGEKDKSGEVPDFWTSLLYAGFARAGSVDASKSFSYRAFELNKKLLDAARLITVPARSKRSISNEDIIKAYNQANKAYQKNIFLGHKWVQGQKLLGIEEREIREILKKGGHSKSTINQMVRGYAEPYQISDTIAREIDPKRLQIIKNQIKLQPPRTYYEK